MVKDCKTIREAASVLSTNVWLTWDGSDCPVIVPHQECEFWYNLHMSFALMTLNDNTEIVHSEILPDGRVRVHVETPDKTDGFHSADCYIPGYSWQDVHGYNEAEIAYYQKLISNMAHLVMRYAAKGGFGNASGL